MENCPFLIEVLQIENKIKIMRDYTTDVFKLKEQDLKSHVGR